MPITKSVKKALRQSEKRQKKNRSFKDRIKSTVKTYLAKPSQEQLRKVESVLDKAKKKGIYHKNKVARLKSSMSKKLTKKEAIPVVKKPTKKATEKKAGSKMSKSK